MCQHKSWIGEKERSSRRIEEVGILPAVRVSSAEEACFARETRKWRFANRPEFSLLRHINPGPIRVQ